MPAGGAGGGASGAVPEGGTRDWASGALPDRTTEEVGAAGGEASGAQLQGVGPQDKGLRGGARGPRDRGVAEGRGLRARGSPEPVAAKISEPRPPVAAPRGRRVPL